MNKKRLSRIVAIGMVSLGLGLILAACQPATPQPTVPPPPPIPSSTPLPDLTGDPVRGGLLYDKWWVILGVDKPSTDQPLWQTQATNTRTGGDTWRCKECHGWDYKGKDGAYGSGSHFTGFPGIFAATGQHPAEILAILKDGSNPDHDFSGVMSEQDLIDLSLFVVQAQIDTSAFVNDDKSAKGGDTAAGQTLFESVCTLCHGPKGTALNFGDENEPEYMGTLASDNPWEVLHKVRFGQPGSQMPSAITTGWTDQDLVNLLAYAQTLPTAPSVGLGGQLYDKWWSATGAEKPATDQPLWQTQTTNTRTGGDTWRCKECHGWDYKGKDGAYSSGSHFTGFPGILASKDISGEELAGWLTGKVNPNHDFSAALNQQYLAALIAFLQQGMLDTAPYINADKSANGDATKGQPLFESACAACHGADGKLINFGDETAPEFVGTIAIDNPWEFFHKVSFGQPGTAMPSGFENGWSLEDIANVLAYAQSLPEK